MNKIIFPLAVAAIVLMTSCSLTKDLKNHCKVYTTGTVRDKVRACVECDSLATHFNKFALKEWRKLMDKRKATK